MSYFRGSFSVESKTASADTAIVALVPPKTKAIARITNIVYRQSTTAHTLRVLKPIAQTTIAATAAASQAVITLTSINAGYNTSGAAENLAANDYLAWENDLGYVEFGIISSINTTTKAVTLAASLAVATGAGKRCWLFYEIGRACHWAVTPAASTTNRYESAHGLVDSVLTKQEDAYNYHSGKGRPLLIYSNNATAAGVLELASGYYSAV